MFILFNSCFFILHNKVDHTYGFIMIARKKCFIHWENGLTFGFRQCKRVGHLIRELLLQKLQCKYIHLSRGQKYSFAYKAKMKVKFLSGWQKFIDLLSNNFAKCFSLFRVWDFKISFYKIQYLHEDKSCFKNTK